MGAWDFVIGILVGLVNFRVSVSLFSNANSGIGLT